MNFLFSFQFFVVVFFFFVRANLTQPSLLLHERAMVAAEIGPSKVKNIRLHTATHSSGALGG